MPMIADVSAPAQPSPGSGGAIPGAGGAPAFTLHAPEPSAVPLLIAVPHAGRDYPDALLAEMRDPDRAALRLEDRLVDHLAHQVARAIGAALLVAHAPRAMIDLNRAPDDVDWDMFRGAPAPDRRRPDRGCPPGTRLDGRARAGLGLVPRRLPGLGELWKQRQDRGALDARLEHVHRPYHACLAQALARLRARWGTALLIDLHSMPPLAATGSAGSPALVIGDRFGVSADGALVAAAFAWAARAELPTAHNRPYAGGYVLERHGAPSHGLHALQIEVDRGRYLDAGLTQVGPGFAGMAAALTGLLAHLADVAAGLAARSVDGRGWAEAAE